MDSGEIEEAEQGPRRPRRKGRGRGAQEESEEEEKRPRHADLCIIGRACTIFADPEVALFLHEEKHMIAPFPGDPKLTVDRFDGRALPGDRKLFMKPAGLKAEAARLGEVLWPSELRNSAWKI